MKLKQPLQKSHTISKETQTHCYTPKQPFFLTGKKQFQSCIQTLHPLGWQHILPGPWDVVPGVSLATPFPSAAAFIQQSLEHFTSNN